MIFSLACVPRSGSSAFMRLLISHGMPVACCGTRFDRSVFELPAGWTGADLPLDGCGVKALRDDGIAVRGNVVRLVRNVAEVHDSWERSLPHPSPGPERIAEWYEAQAAAHPDAPVVRQQELLERPEGVLGVLVAHGWPLGEFVGYERTTSRKVATMDGRVIWVTHRRRSAQV